MVLQWFIGSSSKLQLSLQRVMALQTTFGREDPEPYEHVFAVPVLFSRFTDHFGMFLHLVGELFHLFPVLPYAESGLFDPGNFPNAQGSDKPISCGHLAGYPVNMFPEPAQFAGSYGGPCQDTDQAFMTGLFG